MYLLELRGCHLYNVGNRSVVSVAKGDIVLAQNLVDSAIWRIEKVTDIVTGCDEQITIFSFTSA